MGPVSMFYIAGHICDMCPSASFLKKVQEVINEPIETN